MIYSAIAPMVMALLVKHSQVSESDLDKALSAKIRSELEKLAFTKKGDEGKLSIDKDFNFSYGQKMGAKGNEETKPFGALLRFNGKVLDLCKEFPGFAVGELPNTLEFKTLVLWIKTLVPRSEMAKTAKVTAAA